MRDLFILVLILVVSSCGRVGSNLDTPPPRGASVFAVNEIAPGEALPYVQAAYSQLVDVRTREEYATGHAARAINIPLKELSGRLDRLEKNEPVYVICQSGRRSKEASDFLSRNGFKWVFNITGGTDAWRALGLPMETVLR